MSRKSLWAPISASQITFSGAKSSYNGEIGTLDVPDNSQRS